MSARMMALLVAVILVGNGLIATDAWARAGGFGEGRAGVRARASTRDYSAKDHFRFYDTDDRNLNSYCSFHKGFPSECY